MIKYMIGWDYDLGNPNPHAFYLDGREFDDEQAAWDQAEIEAADEEDANFTASYVVVVMPS